MRYQTGQCDEEGVHERRRPRMPATADAAADHALERVGAKPGLEVSMLADLAQDRVNPRLAAYPGSA
jgi:hypothetical protein